MKRQVLEVLSGKGNTSALTTNDLFILVNETTEITDIFVTGGTYSSGTTEFTFTNNTGGTFNVTGFYIPSATTAYKVFTALLTQSGGDNNIELNSGELTIGITYRIEGGIREGDFTNVGAPNNEVGTYFVATGTIPASWGINEGFGAILSYNEGAPVVTVLENTIGNIWFNYEDVGVYGCQSNDLFTTSKTFISATPTSDANAVSITVVNQSKSVKYISPLNNSLNAFDNGLFNTPIEIRVYN